MVPVVSAEDGQWLLPKLLSPMMKPGGHGAIWKLMLDRGVFEYFSQRRRKAAIVRQIRCCSAALPLFLQCLPTKAGQRDVPITGHCYQQGSQIMLTDKGQKTCEV